MIAAIHDHLLHTHQAITVMTFLIESWFWRGTQSAIFYYLSCAPCTKVNDQRKKRKQAKRAKAEREMEGTFRHPLPSGTNPGWNEEISLGPGPPPKRLNKEQAKRRKRILLKPSETRKLESAGAPSSTGTGTTSMDTTDGQVVTQDLSRISGEGWNFRRYQREDEILWGLENVDTASSDGSSPTLRSPKGRQYHYYARNPEVNELHPPVVSTHSTSRKETQWMLQPPPKAKIMEGKERANRSRSGSGNSGVGSTASRGSLMRGGGENLGRQMGERLIEEKLARREGPLPAPSSLCRAGSNRSAVSSTSRTTIRAQRHDRDLNCTKTLQGSSGAFDQQDSPHSIPQPSFFDTLDAFNASDRPQLPTIPSATANNPHSQPSQSSPQHFRPLVTANSVSSLDTLQKSMASANTSKIEENKNNLTPVDLAKTVSLPPPTLQTHHDTGSSLQAEDWHPGRYENNSWGFPLPNMSLPTRHRWSMDL